MADIHEQRIYIEFCFKLGKMVTETHEIMKNVYGDQCMSRTVVMNGLSNLRMVGSQHEPCVGLPATL
jgi:hypothetical protein